MTQPRPNTERELLKKIEMILEDRSQHVFTDYEVASLRKLIKVMVALEAFGSAGKLIKSILLWLGVVIGAYLAFKNGVTSWLSSLLQ